MAHKDKLTAVTATSNGKDANLPAARHVVMVVFDGVEPLDVSGPASAFAKAEALVPGAYRVTLVSPQGGSVQTNSGFSIAGTRAFNQLSDAIDTLIVAGGDEPALRAAITGQGVGPWIAAVAPTVRRIGSVCTGAFALAAAGVLNQRKSTTHWNACALLQTLCPDTEVQQDCIFVRDGKVWTSAGVTTGLDLALALIEEDVGRPIAVSIARSLALFMVRGATQPQISATLLAQADASSRLRELLAWITGNLAHDHSVPALAARVSMSPRNFARAFASETGLTPLRFVTQARLAHATQLLQQTNWPQEKVALRSGFKSVDALQRALKQRAKSIPN
nr:DJ-1/PfpI family protein [uncultured Rhodoferax sp.]